MKDFIWTTGVSITLDDCTIVLAYVGNLTFIDTIDIDEVNTVLAKEQYASPLYTTLPQVDAMNLSNSANILPLSSGLTPPQQKTSMTIHLV